MNLEEIEKQCLEYLAQAQNPLVPIDELLQHVRAQQGAELTTAAELLQFLRHHELIRVIDGLFPASLSDSAGLIPDAGSMSGSYAILNYRIPLPEQLNALLETQLKLLIDVLSKALQETQQHGLTDKSTQIQTMLTKAEELHQRMKNAL